MNLSYAVLNLSYAVLNMSYAVLNLSYAVLNLSHVVLNLSYAVLKFSYKVRLKKSQSVFQINPSPLNPKPGVNIISYSANPDQCEILLA